MLRSLLALALVLVSAPSASLTAQDSAGDFLPLVVRLGDAVAEPADREAIRRAGGRSLVLSGADVRARARELDQARATLRIRGGAMHLLARGSMVADARDLMQHAGHHFSTLTVVYPPASVDLEAVRAMPARGVHVVEDTSESALESHLRSLWSRPSASPAEVAVHAALDAFHDAATKADEDTYFALLPVDSVFLGTDASERWTGREFREFALPYFQRDTAWTYVCLRRNVTVAADGNVAWFDELLDNESYGACRGSGVLQRREGRWVIVLYDLAMLVPNDASRDVVQRIRAGAVEATTIVLVRHAEKADLGATEKDPPLSEAGLARSRELAEIVRDLPISAVYATPYRRTQDTLAPLCAARALTPTILPAADIRGLIERVGTQHGGGVVVVCGHSNTVPAIARALGVKDRIDIDEQTYDRLFVISKSATGSHLLALRF